MWAIRFETLMSIPANRGEYLREKDIRREWRREELAREKNLRAGYEKIMNLKYYKEEPRDAMR